MPLPTCVALSDFGGGLYAWFDVTFEMMSHINISACTAQCNIKFYVCHATCVAVVTMSPRPPTAPYPYARLPDHHALACLRRPLS